MHLFLFTNSAHGMEAFLTKNEQEDGTVLRLRKPRTEWNRNDRSSTQNGTEQNEKRTERLKKRNEKGTI